MLVKPVRRINYTISDGDKGIYDTVAYMWHYALRDTEEALVKQLVSSLKGKNDLQTIKNIYDWVWRNVKYKHDPLGYEMITAPIHYVNGNRSTGDCDCMTTLLVCLLEASGFDCSIVIIAWRLKAYTHVFAEVWYDNKWFILDPTLKEDGFGRQDKNIKRYRRFTKGDMTKLQVLSDSRRADVLQSPYADAGAKRVSGRHRCCPSRDDLNKNANNININFGTSVENSHNQTDGGGRFVDNISLPRMENIYSQYIPQRAIKLLPPQILRANENSNYELISPVYNRQIFSNSIPKRVAFRTNKKGILNNKRPKYVPSVERNYYQEFP